MSSGLRLARGVWIPGKSLTGRTLTYFYPTLTEMCGLPPKETNEGRSLVPLMEDPKSQWQFAALTTYARKCHALRTDRYRFIQYEDGSEELYDHDNDPDEWENLIDDPEFGELIQRFRFELPRNNAPYHPSTSPNPINAWFKDHLERNGVK